MAMNCPECQSPIVGGQRFCRYCGHRLDDGLQDYIKTEPIGISGRQAPTRHQTNPNLATPIPFEPVKTTPLSTNPVPQLAATMPASSPTTAPVGHRRRWSRPVVSGVAMLSLSVIGWFCFQYFRPGPAIPLVEAPVSDAMPVDAPVLAVEIGTPPVPPTPPPVPDHSVSADRAAPAPAPGMRPHGPMVRADRVSHGIDRILQGHAIQIQKRIERLERQLNHAPSLSPEERAALESRIDELREEKIGVLAVAEVLKAEALKEMIDGLVPADAVFKKIEEELRKNDIHLNREEIRLLRGRP